MSKGLRRILREAPGKMKQKALEISEAIGDGLINKGSRMMMDPSGEGSISNIMGAVIVIGIIANAMPTAYDTWASATDIGGSMGNASEGDKAIWNMGSLGIVGGSVLMVMGLLFKGKV